MTKTEFTKLLRACAINGKLSVARVVALSDEVKFRLVCHIVRNRGPVLMEMIPSVGFDWAWLHSMGYLYVTRGKEFCFVHTAESRIR